MGISEIASVAVKDPVEAWYLVLQRLAPGRLLNRLERLGAAGGLARPSFILSFDCDTDRDIELSWAVHSRLLDSGITPVYAVPGEILEHGADTWRRIASTGAEFINHGYRRHTAYRDGEYVSNLFYDQMSAAEIEADIVQGHASVERVVGRPPEGFRVPHFGTFSSDSELRQLHDILRRLGYRFSTSSTPYIAFRYGPVTQRFGLPELPVTGCVDYPLVILDSYTFRFAENRLRAEDYLAQVEQWVSLLTGGHTFFVNLYADPSQVADWPEFFAAMKRLAPFARPSYRTVLDELKQ